MKTSILAKTTCLIAITQHGLAVAIFKPSEPTIEVDPFEFFSVACTDVQLLYSHTMIGYCSDKKVHPGKGGVYSSVDLNGCIGARAGNNSGSLYVSPYKIGSYRREKC